jgi:hypothetical protein
MPIRELESWIPVPGLRAAVVFFLALITLFSHRLIGVSGNTVHFVGQTIALRGLSRPEPGRRHKLIVCPTMIAL